MINGVNIIRQSIDLLYDNKLYGPAVILIFAGIDTMANIDRPVDREFNNADDFRNWVSKYIDLKGDDTIKPDEWWAARNAITHTFGSKAKAHKDKNIRTILWIDNFPVCIKINPQEPDHILVSIKALKEAFFKGMDRFLPAALLDPKKHDIVEQRLMELVQTIPLNEN